MCSIHCVLECFPLLENNSLLCWFSIQNVLYKCIILLLHLLKLITALWFHRKYVINIFAGKSSWAMQLNQEMETEKSNQKGIMLIYIINSWVWLKDIWASLALFLFMLYFLNFWNYFQRNLNYHSSLYSKILVFISWQIQWLIILENTFTSTWLFIPETIQASAHIFWGLPCSQGWNLAASSVIIWNCYYYVVDLGSTSA